MAEDIKRMRYFDGLFLKQEEFNLEQNYHIRMRRLNNRAHYTPGIVWGLDVTFLTSDSITITKGMALNRVPIDGEELAQEILIPDDTEFTIPVADYSEDDSVYIYISHSLEEADIVEEKGGEQEIHWHEKAFIEHSTDKPTDTNQHIILARVVITASGGIDENIHYDEDNGTPLRTYSALVLEGGLHVGGSADPGKDNLEVEGDCTVKGNLNVQGDTTTVSTQHLEVEDSIITVAKGAPQNLSGLEVDRGGPSEAQIIWKDDEQKWIIGTKGSLVDIAYGSDARKLLDYSSADTLHGHSKLVTADLSIDPALSVDNNGNIGIGTTIPAARLQIGDLTGAYTPDANDQTGILVSTGTSQPSLTLLGQTSTGSFLRLGDQENGIALEIKGDHGDYSYIDAKTAAYGLSLRVQGNESFRIVNNGNVGIGTTTPSEKLEVNGTVKATTFTGVFVGDGSQLTGISQSKWIENPLTKAIYYIAGNVGIATKTPSEKLEVNGTVKATTFMGTTASLTGNLAAEGTIKARQFIGDGSKLTGISQSKWMENPLTKALYYIAGNVGIATEAPKEKLEVNGTVKATSFTGSNASLTGNLAVAGTVTAGQFIGDGSKLTGISQSKWIENPLTKAIYFNAGNVGIRTMEPGFPLEVNGEVKAAVFIGDGSQLTGITAGVWSQESDKTIQYAPSAGTAVQIGTLNNALQLSVLDGTTANPKLTFGKGHGTATIETIDDISLNLDVSGSSFAINGRDPSTGNLLSRLRISNVTNEIIFETSKVFSKGSVEVAAGLTAQHIVAQNITLEGTIAQEGWKGITLMNGWIAVGGAFSPPGYFIDKQGIVHLRGGVTKGPIGTVIFMLPVEYRPAYDEMHIVQTANGPGRCDITKDGHVKHVTGPNIHVSMDGITFRAGGSKPEPIVTPILREPMPIDPLRPL